MAFLDVLNSEKDKQALIAVVDVATLDLVSKIVPAIEAAGERLVDRAADRMKDVLSVANADLASEMKDLKATLAAVLNRLDGAKATITLGK